MATFRIVAVLVGMLRSGANLARQRRRGYPGGRAVATGTAVGLIVLGAVTAAAAADPPEGGWSAALIFENDVLWVDQSDRHYTNGLQLCVHASEGHVWGWLRGLARKSVAREPGTRLNMRIAAGQNLYTPENLKTDELVAEDRPYAGWLHADLGVTGLRGRTLSVLEFSLGLVGPSAGGEALQQWFHQMIGSPDPQGWEHQLHDELAVLAVVQRSWGGLAPPRPVPGLGALGLRWDAIPHVDVNLGNVFTHVGAGAMIRLGANLEQDLGPARIRPAPPGAVMPGSGGGLQWYAFGGAAGRFVLHNIFLDGNTFGDSHRVDKEMLVGDLSVGVALAAAGVRLAFTHTLRSPEFAGQRRPDHFGSLLLAYGR